MVLQANAFPFTAGFANVGNPELTSATGGFAFPVLGLAQATQFRVVTTTNPPVVSPVALESVAVRIGVHVGRMGPRHRARFHGTVSPALHGMAAAIMRERARPRGVRGGRCAPARERHEPRASAAS